MGVFDNISYSVVTKQLSTKKKEIYLSTEYDSEFEDYVNRIRITSLGYGELNKYAGVKILTPSSLMFDGKEQTNPFIMRDNSFALVEVIARKVAFGFNGSGKLTAVDQSIVLNPRRALANSLIPLIERYPVIGEYVNKEAIDQNDIKTGMFMPIVDTGITQMGVFIKDIKHPELLRYWKEYNASVTYADRTAQTLCERNALRKHPGIGISWIPVDEIDENGSVNIKIKYWKYDDVVQNEIDRRARALLHGVYDDIDYTSHADDESDGVNND